MAAPKVGAIIDGYRFLGGDPNSESSWQPAGVDEITAAKTEGAARGKMDARGDGTPTQSAFDDAQVMLRDIGGAKKSVQGVMDGVPVLGTNTGLLGALQAGDNGWWKGIPGTPGYNLARDLDTIKARVGFANLQKMRQNSPTGGAVGNPTDKDIQFLQSTEGNLDVGQGAGQLRQNLDRVRDAMMRTTPGLSLTNPIDLSDGRSRTTIPRGAYYRDPQGNVRRNDNADAGNPIFKPAATKAPALPPGVSVSNWS